VFLTVFLISDSDRATQAEKTKKQTACNGYNTSRLVAQRKAKGSVDKSVTSLEADKVSAEKRSKERDAAIFQCVL
jgi:hypothetical protein